MEIELEVVKKTQSLFKELFCKVLLNKEDNEAKTKAFNKLMEGEKLSGIEARYILDNFFPNSESVYMVKTDITEKPSYSNLNAIKNIRISRKDIEEHLSGNSNLEALANLTTFSADLVNKVLTLANSNGNVELAIKISRITSVLVNYLVYHQESLIFEEKGVKLVDSIKVDDYCLTLDVLFKEELIETFVDKEGRYLEISSSKEELLSLLNNDGLSLKQKPVYSFGRVLKNINLGNKVILLMALYFNLLANSYYGLFKETQPTE